MARSTGADADERRIMVLGALRVALKFGGLVEAAALAARLDGLATRALLAAGLPETDVRPVIEAARAALEPRQELIDRMRSACKSDGAASEVVSSVLNGNAEHGVPLRVRWELGRLLARSANDRARRPELRRAAALARRALVLCDQADPTDQGRPSLLARAVASAPLEVEDIGLDPVRIEVTPAHELADALASSNHAPAGAKTSPTIDLTTDGRALALDGTPLAYLNGKSQARLRVKNGRGTSRESRLVLFGLTGDESHLGDDDDPAPDEVRSRVRRALELASGGAVSLTGVRRTGRDRWRVTGAAPGPGLSRKAGTSPAK